MPSLDQLTDEQGLLRKRRTRSLFDLTDAGGQVLSHPPEEPLDGIGRAMAEVKRLGEAAPRPRSPPSPQPPITTVFPFPGAQPRLATAPPPVGPMPAQIGAQRELLGAEPAEVLRALAGGQPELALATATRAAERPPEIVAERQPRTPEADDSLLRQALGRLGVIDVEAARERQRSQEAAQAAVQLEGGPLPGPGVPGQALAGFANAFTLGVPRAVSEALGFPTGRPPRGVAEEVASGASSLAGFLPGAPLAVGRAVAARTLKFLEPAAKDTVSLTLAKCQ